MKEVIYSNKEVFSQLGSIILTGGKYE